MTIASPARADVRETRRAQNAYDAERACPYLACECTRPACELVVPATADGYRRPGQFVVAPLHVDGERIVVLDDRFLIVRSWSQLAEENS